MRGNRLVFKLDGYVKLDVGDKRLIEEVTRSVRTVEAGETIAHEGDNPSEVHVILEGMACRYKILQTGKRQIVGYMVPGDFCNLHTFLLRSLDHDLQALSACRVVDLSSQQIQAMNERPNLARALRFTTLVDEAVLREWLLNLGARAPEQRIAHFFCEMTSRLQAVGLCDDSGCHIPITQADLAETIGLSTVHTNRSLQNMREEELIVLRRTLLQIPDFDRLARFAGFDGGYLHHDNGVLVA